MNFDKIYVNGPINVVRLEGKINNIDKVLYVFMDYHIDIFAETSCNSYNSEDFVKYFTKTMDKTDKNIAYDLFFEIDDSVIEPNEIKDTRKDIYIKQFVKYFKNTIIKNTTDNKNLGSKLNKNLRLHHIDIRNIIDNNNNAQLLMRELTILINSSSCNNFIEPHDYDTIIVVIKHVKTTVDKHINLLLGKNITLSTTEINNDNDKMKYMIDKIRTKYHDKNLQELIINKSFIMTEIKKLHTNINKNIDETLVLLKKYENLYNNSYVSSVPVFNGKYYGIKQQTSSRYIFDIKNTLEDIYTDVLFFYTNIMDMYFLRRFIDKQYVTHGISYTGGNHSSNYIAFLIKYYDFNITHASYCKGSLNNAMNKIKEKEYNKQLMYDLFIKPIFSQCIDMTDFPKNFL